MNLFSKRPRTVFGVLASIVAVGGAAGCGSSASSSGGAAAATPAAATSTATSAVTGSSAPPAGAPRPGLGTDVTGAAAKQASAVATAKYPGTVEHVEQLSDGSYVVHVIRSSGEVHVLVSKAFAVTGLQQGGPPSGMNGGTPPTGTPPAGAPSTAAPSTSSGSASTT